MIIFGLDSVTFLTRKQTPKGLLQKLVMILWHFDPAMMEPRHGRIKQSHKDDKSRF